MYLRTIQRRNKDGSVVRYVQLAHNVRHPDTGSPVAEVIHSFGREDQLDRDALARLVRSITRYLGPQAELETAPAAAGHPPAGPTTAAAPAAKAANRIPHQRRCGALPL